ncbi:MAG: glycosyltransferase [Bdellovibrionales bacterium]|nr:glycosyltransferase [Bdellovibrionales bacterium]
MTISVIIPTYKRAKQVEYLIHSLRNQNFPKNDLQILLISNLRDDHLREKSHQWKREFYDFKYMETGAKGVNKARNLGIRFSGGEILYFLDDDCLLPSADHLTQLAARHQEWKEVKGIGGGYKTDHNLKGVSRFYYEQQKQWVETVSGNINKTNQLIGGNASYKREVFDKGFVFDSQIIFGGSEESFNRLLVNNGYQLMLFRDLDVYHVIHVNMFSLIQKSFKQGEGHFKGQMGEKAGSQEIDMKKEAAFNPTAPHSWMPFIYHLFFKLGYFWAGSSEKAKGFVAFRILFFFILILKSRWVIVKNHLILGIIWRYAGRLWFYAGRLWFYIGALYGIISVYPIRLLGLIRFCAGVLHGYISRFLGLVWSYVGALYGMLVRFYYRTPLAKLWYFSKYQFYKRIWPLLTGRKKNRN